MDQNIPDIVIGRLPLYLRELSRMEAEQNRLTASSQELAERLGMSSAQIRKDLSHFGEFGKQGTGYHIGYLIQQLRQILKLEGGWPVALVGVGYLGHALVHYNRFQRHDFRIRWLFDNDPEKVGTEVNGILVQSVTNLGEIITREHVKVVILAVPAGAAQEIADLLVDAGVEAILNYAPISLSVPETVHVQYSDPVVQLQHMAYYLNHDA